MGDTYTNFLAHIIFSTKNRQPLITSHFEDQLFAYLGGSVRGEKGHLLAIGGMPDHVHLLIKRSPVTSESDLVRNIKSGSSKWINTNGFVKTRFSWQSGFSGFSVSESEVGRVRKYVLGQKEHHRKMTFKEELIEFLAKHGISYNEDYIWK